jgi:hypothetical protein
MCVLRFSLQLLSETLLILRRIRRDIAINVQGDQKVSVHLMITVQENTQKYFKLFHLP